MWANNILYWLVRVLFIPVSIVSLATTLVGGIIMVIPLVGLVFLLLISLVWLIVLGLLVGAAWFWHRAPPGIRSIATLVGVPAALAGNTFITLMPGGGDPEDQFAKKVKQVICQDWPFAYTTDTGRLLMDVLQEEQHLNFLKAVIEWGNDRTAQQTRQYY